MQQATGSGGARDDKRKMKSGRVESEPATPGSSTSSSQKSTCLRRKKKSRSRGMDSDGDVRMEMSSQESEWEITKRLDFDAMELSDVEPAEVVERLPEVVPKMKQLKTPKKPQANDSSLKKTATKTRAIEPIRNTCILESPLDHKRSHRKRRVYGVRRDEPELTHKRRKRSVQRPMPFALCSLQRMFAP